MWKLKMEIDVNDSLSIEHKEEIQVIFHKCMDLLLSIYLSVLFHNSQMRLMKARVRAY